MIMSKGKLGCQCKTFQRQEEITSQNTLGNKTPGDARCQTPSSRDEAGYEPMTGGYSLSTVRKYEKVG